jgi:hypothetical protein
LRRVVVTNDVISFAFVKDEMEIDNIPLSEVEFVKEMAEVLENRPRVEVLDPGDGAPDNSHALQISTAKEGHNSGRAYYLRVESQEQMETFMTYLQKSSKAARRRAEARSFFRKSQYQARKIYESNAVQSLVAALIAAVSRATLSHPTAPCWSRKFEKNRRHTGTADRPRCATPG